MNHALALAKKRAQASPLLEQPGPEGDAARAETGRALYELNVRQYCCAGLNFGYYYDRSPQIAYDGEPHPGYDMDRFTSSTVPGCRLPHLWLDGSRSLYDALGAGFTLLRLDAAADPSPLVAAAAARGVPLSVLDVDLTRVRPDAAVDGAYRHALVLARPDQHVAWRGNAAPADPGALIDQVRGAS